MKPTSTDLLASRGTQIAGIATAALAALQAFGAIDPATTSDGGWLAGALSSGLDRIGAGGTGALAGLAIFAQRIAARLKMRGGQVEDVLEYSQAIADTVVSIRAELDVLRGTAREPKTSPAVEILADEVHDLGDTARKESERLKNLGAHVRQLELDADQLAKKVGDGAGLRVDFSDRLSDLESTLDALIERVSKIDARLEIVDQRVFAFRVVAEAD